MSLQIIYKIIVLEMDKSKIALLTTVINWELYHKSSQHFPKNIRKFVIDGSNGMFGIDSIFFMMKKLKNKNIDWLIMADEDVLFINPDLVYTTIDEMISKDFIVSGVRDGGLITNRTYSPYLINTFFSIVNFKVLESIWNEKEIRKNQYVLDNEFYEDLSALKTDYDTKSLYEPYYCFYFWLRRKGKKILFLDAVMPFKNDEKTTLVYAKNGNEMLYHTWYARSYGNNEKHTKRIDDVFSLLQFHTGLNSKPIVYKDYLFHLKRKLYKLRKRIYIRLKLIFKGKE